MRPPSLRAQVARWDLAERLARPRPGEDLRRRPWRSAIQASTAVAGDAQEQACVICGWRGAEFVGGYHSEGAGCPHCGSIARDRYLFWCWIARQPYSRSTRVLETSPRLGQRYRSMMRRRVRYLCSDYDESAHRAEIKLDLQSIDLPDASLDTILTPHVLEHVPDTGRALSELHRVLAPGGRMYLQIPMVQGVTAPPTEPEYHGDNTLVYWRFGWDLGDMLRAAGFTTTALVTESLRGRIAAGPITAGYAGPDCDEVDLLNHADAAQLTVVATDEESRRYGFLPDFQFITWEAAKA